MHVLMPNKFLFVPLAGCSNPAREEDLCPETGFRFRWSSETKRGPMPLHSNDWAPGTGYHFIGLSWHRPLALSTPRRASLLPFQSKEPPGSVAPTSAVGDTKGSASGAAHGWSRGTKHRSRPVRSGERGRDERGATLKEKGEFCVIKSLEKGYERS